MIVDDHEQRDQHHTDDTHPDAVLDVGFTQLGIGVKDSVDFDLEGESAGNKGIGDALGFIFSEGTGNFCAAAGDGALNSGSTVEFAVKDDGKRASDVVGGDASEILGTLQIESEGDLPLTELVTGGHSHGDVFTVHGNMTVNKEILDQRFFPCPELLSLHQLIAAGDAEVLGIFQIFLSKSIVVGVDKTEMELGTHLDEFKEFQLFILCDNGGTQSHIIAA